MKKWYPNKLRNCRIKRFNCFDVFFLLKNVIISFAFLLTMNSCLPYKEVWLNPHEKANAILPNLTLLIDSKNVAEQLFTQNKWTGENITIAVIDGKTLLSNFVTNNIIDNRGSSRGSIEIAIKKNYHKINNVGFFVLSTLTVYTINLIGFPMISQKASITINVKIKNNAGNIIKEYSEEGIGRATSAMYWGYTFGGGLTRWAPYGLPRTVNTFALSNGLEKLKKDISVDSKELNRRLYE
jgi:hypothetical protein